MTKRPYHTLAQAPDDAADLDDSMIVATSHRGHIDRDDRGDARWKWATEQEAPTDPNAKTFNFLDALEDLEIVEDRGPPAEPEVPKGSGYNPYAKERSKR